MRVRSAWNSKASKAAKGRVKVSKVPFWIDQQTQELNHRADDARLMFRLTKEGMGQRAMTDYLNEHGIPSSRGGTWGKSMVQDVLKSKAAYGSLVIKGEEVRDYYPPIIGETEWLAIQHRQRSRHRNAQAGNTRNLFPRLLRCGHCGSTVNLSSTLSRGKLWSYLVCEGRALKRTVCTQRNWRYDEFERDLVEKIGLFAIVLQRKRRKHQRPATP